MSISRVYPVLCLVRLSNLKYTKTDSFVPKGQDGGMQRMTQYSTCKMGQLKVSIKLLMYVLGGVT